MAEEVKKQRRLKKTESLRERAEKASESTGKPRRLNRTASTAGRPLKATGRAISKVLRPFRFILKPFRTRPVRFIGRFLAAIFFFRYFRESWAEVRQVKWPTLRETTRLSIAVFLFALAFGLIIALTDYGLDKIFKKLILE